MKNKKIQTKEEKKAIKNQDKLEIIALKALSSTELINKAKSLNIKISKKTSQDETILKIMEENAKKDGLSFINGILEILPEGFGFLRIKNYLPSPNDIYISQTQIKRFGLKVGDHIHGHVRPPKEGERYFSLLKIEAINNDNPLLTKDRQHFSNLTPVYPDKKINLEIGKTPLSTRIIDLIAPIGEGQRAMIVSPPKAGKTTLLKEIATSISHNHPECLIKVLLIDERPEEVTDMKRSVKGEVVYSTFDEPPEQHVKVSELVLESAKRLVEAGKKVVILLDSITRLARAYNLVVPPSGRTLSGGLDPSSLHKPKRFFGGARNIEKGGSLTIIATSLIDTGSRMDDIIYEEFKGTGNMELHLLRKLSNKRIFPAIDILNSGTRKEDLLINESNLKKIYLLRKNIENENAIEELINLMKQTHTNKDFLNSEIFA
eukprot:COSAG01_NODE_2_length_63927_cov_1357.611941_55_plen_432_part_00